jgi:hypothetical protein
MKVVLTLLLVFGSMQLMAKEVKDFNKILIQDVQKDISSDNDHALKTKESIRRGPASVEEEQVEADPAALQEENKIDKNFRQIGSKNW